MTDVRVAMGTTYRKVYCQRVAFTIIELVVSLGILSILLVMAGSVFTLTLKSSGEATALIEVKERAAAIEQSLREDLRYVTPGNSLMVIQGNPINTYWTNDEQDADSDNIPFNDVPVNRDPQREFVDMSLPTPELRRERPRADVLMFFTNRPGKSYVNPTITGRLQQVVYGHAELRELRELTPTSLNWPWPPVSPDPLRRTLIYDNARFPRNDLKFNTNSSRYDLVSPALGQAPKLFATPAHDWVLARRSVVIVDGDLSSVMPALDPAADLNDGDETRDDSVSVATLTLKRKNFIRDGRRDYLQNGYDFDGDGSPDFDYELDVVQRPADPDFDNDPSNSNATINWIARSQLDPTPPPAFASRLGHYFVPNCAGFKVEWALELDAPAACGEIIWVDPGDIAGTVVRIQALVNRYTMSNPACSQSLQRALNRIVPKNPGLDSLPDRFCDFGVTSPLIGEPLSTHIFYTSEPDSLSSATTPDPLFPKALRITVDLYDSAGRLDRPVRHVMVLPVGSD